MGKVWDAEYDRIFASFSPLAELDLRACELERHERIMSARVCVILSHSALVQLRSLSLPVNWPIDSDVLQELHRFPLLSHLHIAGRSPPKSSAWIWPALLRLPALTSLSTALILIEPCLNEGLVAAQAGLSPIIHLRLERAVFLPGRFERLFGLMPRLRALRSLTLVKWTGQRGAQPDWSVFACLHTLHLREFFNIAEMLPALRFLKPLRLLTVSPAPLAPRPPTVPQPIGSLIELLQQSSELRVTLFVVRPAFGSFVCPADAATLYPDEPPETRAQLAQLADRLCVQPDESELQ